MLVQRFILFIFQLLTWREIRENYEKKKVNYHNTNNKND